MRVLEIYKTIQGEGIWMGRPVVLIRLAGCCNKCPWCDTKYSWELNHGMEFDLDTMYTIIESMKLKRILITGGEPLLQPQSVDLAKLLKAEGYEVAIETSGCKVIDPNFREYFDVITISPKQHIETPFDLWELPPTTNIYYKFVVGYNSWSFKRILYLVQEYHIDPERVWIMPLTVSHQFDENLCKSIWEFCVEHGFNYSDRLHVRVFKNEPYK